MARTGLTIPARTVGALASIIVIAGLFMPWATFPQNLIWLNQEDVLPDGSTELNRTAGEDMGREIRPIRVFFPEIIMDPPIGIFYAPAILILFMLAMLTFILSIFGVSTMGLGVLQFLTAFTYVLVEVLAFPKMDGAEWVPFKEMGLAGPGVELVGYGLWLSLGASFTVFVAGILIKVDQKKLQEMRFRRQEHQRALLAYESALEHAISRGQFSTSHDLFGVLREGLGVSEREHDMIASRIESRGIREPPVAEESDKRTEKAPPAEPGRTAMDVLRELAVDAYKDHDFDFALKCSNRYLKENKMDDLLWFVKAGSHFQLEEYEKAARSFGIVLKLDPANEKAKKGLERSEAMLEAQKEVEREVQEEEEEAIEEEAEEEEGDLARDLEDVDEEWGEVTSGPERSDSAGEEESQAEEEIEEIEELEIEEVEEPATAGEERETEDDEGWDTDWISDSDWEDL